MTNLLEKVFDKVSKLPDEEQNKIAKWLLAELDDEKEWNKKFRSSGELLENLSKEALEEYKAGNTTELTDDQL